MLGAPEGHADALGLEGPEGRRDVNGEVGRVLGGPADGHDQGRRGLGVGGPGPAHGQDTQDERETARETAGAGRRRPHGRILPYNAGAMPRLTLRRASPVRRRLLRLYEALHHRYGAQGWWPARSAFEVVAGALLAQHAAWPAVEPVVARLRAAGSLTPSAVGRLAPGGLAASRARRLRAFVDHLAARHGGHLGRMLRQPMGRLRAELLGVPGIGPETADAVLLYAAGRPV
ncbi:MAG: hypothetical protein DMD79_24025, partial [Candidatus Rokuibacteriota bacterium]